ncbi:BrnA antitoxin family protein [Halovulum sp. GXIMD14793]
MKNAKDLPKSEARKRTRVQERLYTEMLLTMLETNQILSERMILNEGLPKAWHKLHQEAPCVPEKTKVTIRLDTKTVKWFKTLGSGWHNRIDAVLKSYALALMSKEIEISTDRDWYSKPI